jgi:hypothetical protein
MLTAKGNAITPVPITDLSVLVSADLKAAPLPSAGGLITPTCTVCGLRSFLPGRIACLTDFFFFCLGAFTTCQAAQRALSQAPTKCGVRAKSQVGGCFGT